MKTSKLQIIVELVTNLPIDREQVIDAMEKMIYSHPKYDKDDTVAAITHVSFKNWSL
jgi:hypothetical protein